MPVSARNVWMAGQRIHRLPAAIRRLASGRGNRGSVLNFQRCKCSTKVSGRIMVGAARSDGIPEYLTRTLLCPVCRLDLSARLQLSQCCQQFRRFDVTNGPVAKFGKKLLEGPLRLLMVAAARFCLANHSSATAFLRGSRRATEGAGGSSGARGRSRTDTLLRAADFLPTSAFAALIARSGSWSGARLHHSPVAVGARRLLSTPSHAFARAWLGVSSSD